MFAFLSIISALAASPVAVLGDGVVLRGQTHGVVRQEIGWASVMIDCLEEAKPGSYAVVDRSSQTLTYRALAEDIRRVRELSPQIVVVGVVHPDKEGVDQAVLEKRLGAILRSLRSDGGPMVYLVGAVAPLVEGMAEEAQRKLDAEAAAHSEPLKRLAKADDGVWFVDLWTTWPRQLAARHLLQSGSSLSDQAHARVGAAICEEILKNLKNAPK